ncbi:MAG: hypothetical protein DMD26_08630 [Gemmatimonadetes bacterium]|nr:MAG: hypothetical protein DMD26_08630 [Gemmatimonadota bacterium]
MIKRDLEKLCWSRRALRENRVLSNRSESFARAININAVSAWARRVVSVCAIELRSARNSSCNVRMSPVLARHPVVPRASTTDLDARKRIRVPRVRRCRSDCIIMSSVC